MTNNPENTDKVNTIPMIDASNETKGKMELEQIANLFIQVANDLADTQNIGQIGRAMRLAASMFNSHEYAMKSPDMEIDKADVTEWLVNEYRSMLTYHIDLQKSMRENKSSGCS